MHDEGVLTIQADNPHANKQSPSDMGDLVTISQIKGSKLWSRITQDALWLHIRITQEAFKTHQCPGPGTPGLLINRSGLQA